MWLCPVTVLRAGRRCGHRGAEERCAGGVKSPHAVAVAAGLGGRWLRGLWGWQGLERLGFVPAAAAVVVAAVVVAAARAALRGTPRRDGGGDGA